MLTETKTFHQLKDEISAREADLIAVSKTRGPDEIQRLYESGQRLFGENYVQELLPKHEALPKDIEWHMIGHLQSNKVKYIAPFISMIQSVDSESLLHEISKHGKKNNRQIACLLEMRIATEDTKYGLSVSDAKQIIAKYISGEFPFVIIRGIMGMASNDDDRNMIRKEFRQLKNLFDEIKKTVTEDFNILSMGMSNDYDIAMEEGSNMVRLGSALFGKRLPKA
jgi:pyridoxal phosphate enzyme (YggS family)